MDTFIFIHGVNGVAWQWEPVAEVIAADDTNRVIKLDLPNMDAVEDIADWVGQQIPHGSIIVGHSFGGVIAQALLERHPEKCTALALINASLRADLPERTAERLGRIGAMKSEDEYITQMTSNLERVYHPKNAKNEALIRDRKKSVSEYGLAKFKAHSTALINRVDRTEMMEATQIPVLVIAAAGDLVVPAPEQAKWAEEIGAPFLQLPQAGHMLPSESPVELGLVLKHWATQLTDQTRHTIS